MKSRSGLLVALCLLLGLALSIFAIADEGPTVCDCESAVDCVTGCDICLFAEYQEQTDTVFCEDQLEWIQCCARSPVDSVCRWDPDLPIE